MCHCVPHYLTVFGTCCASRGVADTWIRGLVWALSLVCAVLQWPALRGAPAALVSGTRMSSKTPITSICPPREMVGAEQNHEHLFIVFRYAFTFYSFVFSFKNVAIQLNMFP